MRYKLINTAMALALITLAFGPPILALYFQNPAWMAGWAIILLLSLIR